MIHTEFSFKEKERIKALSERTIGISALNYNRSNPAQSYITTTNGKTDNGIYNPKEEKKAQAKRKEKERQEAQAKLSLLLGMNNLTWVNMFTII